MVLDDFVPANHLCRMVDAFVEKLVMSEFGFERPGQGDRTTCYDPRELLNLYLFAI